MAKKIARKAAAQKRPASPDPTFESRSQRLRTQREKKSVAAVPLLERRGASGKEFERVQEFLKRFRHSKGRPQSGVLDEVTAEALANYQRFHGLAITSVFDLASRDHMLRSRCGLPDKVSGSPVAANVLCSWDQCEITYAFDVAPADVPANKAFDAVRRAIATWDRFAPIRSREVGADENPDVVIGWRPAADPDFDMTGGTLAHADFPPGCTVVATNPSPLHFDDEEHPWGIGDEDAFDIETLALHEWGHILGLGHSSNGDAIMAPTFEEGETKRGLHEDDLDGLFELYPGYRRRGDSANQAGEIRSNACIRHRTSQVISAVRTSSNTLRLIAWQVDPSGAVNRTGDSGNQVGISYEADIARGDRYVVACRTAAGTLKLISWDVNNAGTAINRRGDSANQAGSATLIRIGALAGNRFVTACRASSGDLVLITWRLEVDGSLTRLHDSHGAAGQIHGLALTVLAPTRVATSVRASNGSLKVIAWEIAANGTIDRLGDSGSLAGEASQIASCLDEHGHLITAVRAGNDSLVLIAWSIDAAGGVTRLGDSAGQAGETKEHDLMQRPGGVVAAVRTGAGTMKLVGFSVSVAGGIARERDSHDLAGAATLIRLTDESLAGANPIVTAVRTAGKNLKLISWAEATCFGE